MSYHSQPKGFTRNYGRKARTMADKRAAAVQLLVLKRELTGNEVETLERSYGLSRDEAVKLVNDERRRRAA